MNVAPRPYTLIAEITYRCPLHCVYCSNPTSYRDHAAEMETGDWLRLLDEAARLGVVQTHFTGGEPLARADLETLVSRAHERGMYTNLVTSGVPLERARLEDLAARGLDHVQLSVQGSDAASSRDFADSDAFAQKLDVARFVRELDLPLTINVVLHRGNLHMVADVIALAEKLEADRLELANVQFHGFALENKDALMPTYDALERAQREALAAKERLAGKMDVLFVKPDHSAPPARVHGRLGASLRPSSSGRHGGPVSRGDDDHVALVRTRERFAIARRDLGDVARARCVSRRRVDARAVCELSIARTSTSAGAAARPSPCSATRRAPIPRVASRPITHA